MVKNNKNKKNQAEKKTAKKVSKRKKISKDIDLEFKALQDKHLRLKAEFDNFRRRKSEEISRLLQYDGENVIKGFLPILDDLNRMINTGETSEESLKNGIVLVNSKIQKYFDSLDIVAFGEKGEKMDPNLHDAVLTQEDKDSEVDVILDVFEKGYSYRDKVIRHAKVIVNKK